MVAKIVVVKGCSRRVRCASPAATATIVPTAIWLAYRLATWDRAEHRQLQHALRDGRLGQALRLRGRDCLARRRRHRARGGLDGARRRQRRAGGRGGPASGVPDCGAHARLGAAHPAAAGRAPATPGSPGPIWRNENKALYMDGVRPVSAQRPGAGTLAGGRAGHLGHRRPGAACPADRGDAGAAACARCGPTVWSGRRWCVDLTVEGRPISVAGTHMSHLHIGSHRNWAELRRGTADGGSARRRAGR